MKKQINSSAPDNTAAIYARYSSHNQREESLEAQIRACRAYAASKGLEIVKIYTDAAQTGTNADREQFQRMIEDSDKKLFKNLIIHKLDRFSRDKFDAVTYKRRLKMNGITLMSVTENLDGSPESTILESLLEGMAQYYSQNLSREVAKGMKESAYKCTHLGGFAPLGYDVDPVTKKYVINETEAKTVRIIFEKYADGVGYNQILEYLNGMGHKTKQGNTFKKNSLNNILHNEKYVGTFVFNRKLEKDVSGKRRPQWKPEEEWIRVEKGLPAIIDADTFNKVQLKLVENLKIGGKFKAKEIYLLSGLTYCGECGSSMYGNTRHCGRGKTKYSSYRCSDRANHAGCDNKELRKEYAENYVLNELYDKLFSDNSIKRLSVMLNEYNQKQLEGNNEELKLAEGEFVAVMGKIGTVVKLVAESGISIETVKDELKRLEDRKRFLENYISELTMQSKANAITEDMIQDLITKSREFVKTKNIAECRNFIQNYIEKVTIYNNRVEVLFKINVPDENSDSLTQLKCGEGIKAIQKEYRAV